MTTVARARPSAGLASVARDRLKATPLVLARAETRAATAGRAPRRCWTPFLGRHGHGRWLSSWPRPRPTAPELAQGPLAVAALGMAGGGVGRLVPTALLAPVLAVVLMVSMVPEGTLRWFAPIVNPAETVPGGYWPHPEMAPRTELVALAVAVSGGVLQLR